MYLILSDNEVVDFDLDLLSGLLETLDVEPSASRTLRVA
jgi:hypothetical protein